MDSGSTKRLADHGYHVTDERRCDRNQGNDRIRRKFNRVSNPPFRHVQAFLQRLHNRRDRDDTEVGLTERAERRKPCQQHRTFFRFDFVGNHMNESFNAARELDHPDKPCESVKKKYDTDIVFDDNITDEIMNHVFHAAKQTRIH